MTAAEGSMARIHSGSVLAARAQQRGPAPVVRCRGARPLADDQEGDDEQDHRHDDNRDREDRHTVARSTHRPRRSVGPGTPVREGTELGSAGRWIMLGFGHAPTVSALTWP